jgi:hypothetical protein
MDVSAFVRQTFITALEKASDTPDPAPPRHPEDCLAVVVGHASPIAQRRLAEAFARLDRIRTHQRCTRLWFVAETLALWAARVEAHVHIADE